MGVEWSGREGAFSRIHIMRTGEPVAVSLDFSPSNPCYRPSQLTGWRRTSQITAPVVQGKSLARHIYTEPNQWANGPKRNAQSLTGTLTRCRNCQLAPRRHLRCPGMSCSVDGRRSMTSCQTYRQHRRERPHIGHFDGIQLGSTTDLAGPTEHRQDLRILCARSDWTLSAD